MGHSPCSRSLPAPMLTPQLVRQLSRRSLARYARAPWPALATAATTTWTSPAARVSGEKYLCSPVFLILRFVLSSTYSAWCRGGASAGCLPDNRHGELSSARRAATRESCGGRVTYLHVYRIRQHGRSKIRCPRCAIMRRDRRSTLALQTAEIAHSGRQQAGSTVSHCSTVYRRCSPSKLSLSGETVGRVWREPLEAFLFAVAS